MIEVEELSSAHQLYQHRAEWDGLVARAGDASVFHSFEWITTWLECFWLGRPIAVLLLRRGGRLVAILPLLRDDGGELWCSGSLVWPVNEHAHRTELIHDERFVSDSEVFAALLDHLERQHRGRRLALPELLIAGPTARHLAAAARQHGLSVRTRAATSSPIVELRGDWEQYLRSRTPHVRRELGRKQRRLARAGRVEWRTCSTSEECDPALEDVFHIERHSWKEGTGSAFSSKTKLSLFYRELARRCARKGRLCIHLLYLDSEPIAHIYGLTHRSELYFLKTSYSDAHRRLSPGAVLFGFALQDAAERGVEIVDLLGVDESRWKRELMTGVRQHWDACCFSDAHYRCRACRLYREQLVPLIKQRLPRAVVAKRRIQRALPRLF